MSRPYKPTGPDFSEIPDPPAPPPDNEPYYMAQLEGRRYALAQLAATQERLAAALERQAAALERISLAQATGPRPAILERKPAARAIAPAPKKSTAVQKL